MFCIEGGSGLSVRGQETQYSSIHESMKRRAPKKTVSFSEGTRKETNEPQAVQLEFAQESKSALLVPFHLPLILYGMFRYGLTDNPFATMAKGYLNLLLVQLVYGFLLARHVSGTRGKKASSKGGHNGVFLVVSSTVMSILLTNVVFVIFILFGAPMYGFLKETYLLSGHISLILLQPLFILFELDFERFKLLFKSERIYRCIFTNQTLSCCFLTILGCWFGVIPIPLDWDRPWQSWPITILTGGYYGAVMGSIIGLINK